MELIKSLIAKHLVAPFKSFPLFGRTRFWILYWSYKITKWHIRAAEWDFVLDYLPELGAWQKVSVLDVGCSRSLFCHEVVARGYDLLGVDLEIPNFKYPAMFVQNDITKGTTEGNFDFVTCISVFEHIEPSGQNQAMINMIESLKIGGRLLITIPTKEFAQGHPWYGFTSADVKVMIDIKNQGKVIEYTERAGQICMAIERVL